MQVLIVGDSMLDEFVLCEPGTSSGGEPILRERERVYRPGGAAGVACVAQSLGAQVVMFGLFGDDESGILLGKSLLEEIEFFYRSHAQTTRKTRIRCLGRREVRIDRDCRGGKWQRPSREDIAKADAVVLADYDKGALDPDERQRLVKLCNDCGVPCVVGAARGVPWSEYAGATIISATQTEAWAAGYPQAHRAPLYCLTADRLGLRIIDPSGASHRARYTVAEVDALGCGDSVCAALAAGLAERLPLDALSSFAAAVGAVQATRGPGVQPVTRSDVAALLDAASSPA